jgi:hypothetical protein
MIVSMDKPVKELGPLAHFRAGLEALAEPAELYPVEGLWLGEPTLRSGSPTGSKRLLTSLCLNSEHRTLTTFF